ncbi:g11885 [Coccomyxa elongata]
MQLAEDKLNGFANRAAEVEQELQEKKDTLSRLLWDHAQLGHKLARAEAERDTAKNESQAARQECTIAKAACKEQQLRDARIKETAESARKYQAAVICEQELSKRVMAAKNRAEAALAEKRKAAMAARAGRAAAECKLEIAEQTILRLQSQLAEAALRSTARDAGTGAPDNLTTPQVPDDAAGRENALPQEPEHAAGTGGAPTVQQPKQAAVNRSVPLQLAADMAAARAVHTHIKRAAEVPPQHASTAKRTKPEEFAATWEAKGRDVVVEYAGNRIPQLCAPTAAEFPTCMERDGHDVVVQDASPVFLKLLFSAS